MTELALTRHRVLTVPVDIPAGIPPEQSLQGYVDWLMARVGSRQGTHVITCNAEMAILAQRDPEFGLALAAADLVVPDGAGVVWALGRQGIRVYRAPGIELAEHLIEHLDVASTSAHLYRIALIGAKPEVNQKAQIHWRHRCPNLQIWGHHGYFESTQAQTLLRDLKDQDPQVVLVGLGSPRQEAWIRANRFYAPEAIWIGVGGSLDIWAGDKMRAPQWWRDHRLEWLYRLYQDPWRWRRMLALPRFVWQVWWS